MWSHIYDLLEEVKVLTQKSKAQGKCGSKGIAGDLRCVTDAPVNALRSIHKIVWIKLYIIKEKNWPVWINPREHSFLFPILFSSCCKLRTNCKSPVSVQASLNTRAVFYSIKDHDLTCFMWRSVKAFFDLTECSTAILHWQDSSGLLEFSSLCLILGCLCKVFHGPCSLFSMLPLHSNTILPDPEGSFLSFSIILVSNTQSISSSSVTSFSEYPPEFFLSISRAKILI